MSWLKYSFSEMTEYGDKFGGSKYFFSDQGKSWEDARVGAGDIRKSIILTYLLMGAST